MRNGKNEFHKIGDVSEKKICYILQIGN